MPNTHLGNCSDTRAVDDIMVVAAKSKEKVEKDTLKKLKSGYRLYGARHMIGDKNVKPMYFQLVVKYTNDDDHPFMPIGEPDPPEELPI